MPHFARSFVAAAAIALVCAGDAAAAPAQTLTRAMVEAQIREWIAAYDSNDVDRVLKADPHADGFGWRVIGVRSSKTPESERAGALRKFFGGMDYYHVLANELHADVDSDIGLAWGFFTEDFKQKGRAPEKLRVRFTSTLKYENGQWRTLLYHRDIQSFDGRGNYIPIQ